MRAKRRTVFRSLPKREFNKTETELKSIRNAKNKIHLKFPLNNMNKFINESGTQKKKNIYIFIQSQGPDVIQEVLSKFNDNESISEICLSILQGCAKNLPDEHLAEFLTLPMLIETIIETGQKNPVDIIQNFIMNFFLIISQNSNILSNLNDGGIIQFLSLKLEIFIDHELDNFKVAQLNLLAQIMRILEEFAKHREVSQELGTDFQTLIDNLIKIYMKNNEITFLRDNLLKILVNLSLHSEGKGIIQNSNLDLQQMANSIFSANNLELDAKMTILVINYLKNSDLEEKLNELLEKFDDSVERIKLIIFLSYSSKDEKFFDVFENYGQVADKLLEMVKQNSLKEIEKSGCISFLQGIMSLNKSLLNHFVQEDGPSIVFGVSRYLGFLAKAKKLNLLNACLKVSPDTVIEQLEQIDAINLLLKDFSSDLKEKFNQYKEKGMNIERALDSIEFQKSETTRIILESLKEVKRGKIVPMDLALEFLGCKDYLISICKFFSLIFMKKSKYSECTAEFLETCFLSIKIYKKNKIVHEAVFETLSKMKFDTNVAIPFVKGKEPFNLCEIVWKESSWKLVGYHLLNFWNKLLENNLSLSASRDGKFCIRLIASITHFVNDKEYEEIIDRQNEIMTEADNFFLESKKKKTELNLQQEREIINKGSKLLTKMIDTTMLDTFKAMIDSQIDKFVPKLETIQILRADYAVLAVLNGIKFFGNLGITNNMHYQLYKNVNKLPKKEYENKGKLMSDCVRAIANYIKITSEVKSVNNYKNGNVSVLVFDLLSVMLRNYKIPEDSWLVLRAFREWLLNRIKIIEEADDNMRYRIYDPESFLMTPEEERERLITEALDSLYGTYQKFPKQEKIVALVFEIIILLGYIYPGWRNRVAKEFIPLALEALKENDFSEETDKKILQCLKFLTGTDEKSEEGIQENIDNVALKGGIDTIAEVISKHDFNKDFIKESRPLLESLQDSNESKEAVQADLNKLINTVKDFNDSSDEDKTDPTKRKEVEEAIQKINVLCCMDGLRQVCLENGYHDMLKRLLDYGLNREGGDVDDLKWKRKLKKLALIGLNQNIEKTGEESPTLDKIIDKQIDNLGKNPEDIKTLLNTLIQEKNAPEMVALITPLVNKFFPSDHSFKVKEIAKEMNFQPQLEYIFEEYGKSENPEFSAQVTNLYLNLSSKIDEKMKEKLLKRLKREVSASLEDNNIKKLNNALKNIKPFLNDEIWLNEENEFDLLEIIRESMKMVHSNSTMKMEQDSYGICSQSLNRDGIPGLSSQAKTLLSEEIETSEDTLEIIKNLPAEIKKRFNKADDLIAMFPLLSLFNGTIGIFDIYDDILKNKNNEQGLNDELGFECLTAILMKNNKDCFKVDDFEMSSLNASDVGLSIIRNTFGNRSKIEGDDLKASSLENLAKEKNNQIKKNIEKFKTISKKLLNEKKQNEIIEEYVSAVNKLNLDSEQTKIGLIKSSRLFMCGLKSGFDQKVIQSNIDSLMDAFNKFLEKNEKNIENECNKKTWNFFNRIMRKVFKQNGISSKTLKNNDIWNKIISKNFVRSPDHLNKNLNILLKNLDVLFDATNINENQFYAIFNENTNKIEAKFENFENNFLSVENQNSSVLVANHLLEKLKSSSNFQVTKLLDILTNLSKNTNLLEKWKSNEIYNDLFLLINDFENDEDVFLNLVEMISRMLNIDEASNLDLLEEIERLEIPKKLIQLYESKLNMENLERSSRDQKNFSQISKLLICLLEKCKNKISMTENNLPDLLSQTLMKSKLVDFMVENFIPGNSAFDQLGIFSNALLLFMFLWNDKSLANKHFNEEKDLMSQLLRLVDARVKSINNGRVFPFNIESNLHNDIYTTSNGNIFSLEVLLYALAEFSETSDGRRFLQESNQTYKDVPLFKRMYVLFSKNDQIPLIATKFLQITRNLVVNYNQDELREFGDSIIEITGDIKIKRKKFDGHNYVTIPRYLNELIFQNDEVVLIKKNTQEQKVKSLELFGEAIQKKFEKDMMIDKDLLEQPFEVAKIIKETKEKLDKISKGEADELTKAEKKNFEMALDKLNEKIKANNEGEIFEFVNLDTHQHLREIANNEAASIISRQEALENLNIMCNEISIKKKMSRDPFFVAKSVELIQKLIESNNKKSIVSMKNNEKKLLLEDLRFLSEMTDYSKGAFFCLKEDSERSGKLIDNLINIITDERNEGNVEHKKESLNILLNLFKQTKDPQLEDKFLQWTDKMLKTNENQPEIDSPCVLMVGLLCSKNSERFENNQSPEMEMLADSVIFGEEQPVLGENDENKVKANKTLLIEKKNILAELEKSSKNNLDHVNLMNNLSFTIFNIIDDSPEYQQLLLESDILNNISEVFKRPIQKQMTPFYSNTLDILLQLSYNSQGNQDQLVKNGFSKGLVALLIFYSQKNNYNEDLCLKILKVMANFSLIKLGSQTLIEDGVISAFINFFNEYKEKLDIHFEVMLSVISNLTYERDPSTINIIHHQKGLNLIVDCVEFYNQRKNAVCLEICLDCLTHMSSSPEVCKALEETTIMDLLIDIMRHKLNSNLIYKDLRCLIIFIDYEKLASKFVDKQGPALSLDLLTDYREDPKNVFSILKLNHELIKRYSDSIDIFVESGIPEKIVSNFNRDWAIQIIILMLQVLELASVNENVRSIIGDTFLPELMFIIDKYFDRNKLVRTIIGLFSVISENVSCVDSFFHLEANELSDKILKNFMSHSKIVYKDLVFMENMIRLKDDGASKKQLLDLKTDFLVEKVVETTDKVSQKELNKQAIIVLELLRDKKIEVIEEEDEKELEAKEKKEEEEEKSKTTNIKSKKSSNLKNSIPIDIQQFLRQGKILTLHGEDGVKRTMHFFLSSDLSDLKCKKPREDTVKPKWIIPIHKVKKIRYKYDEKSPIAKSGGFFRKAPTKEKCFAVFGPETMYGPKNFHFECASNDRARQWYSYLTLVHNEYLSKKAKKLNEEEQIDSD